MIQPVILCGGDGVRLWPSSRKTLPKQFMPLHGSTLFMETVKRVACLKDVLPPLILCNVEHRFLAAEQLRDALENCPGQFSEPVAVQDGCAQEQHFGPGTIILEPAVKNTAPAAALAALHLLADDPVLLLLPADHCIEQLDLFRQSIEQGQRFALAGALVTFGIKPCRPETGYGYIQQGALLAEGVASVASFIEKPDLPTAEKFQASGKYLWNSGIFLFKPSVFLDELQQYAPDIAQSCRAAYAASSTDLDFIRIGSQDFASCPANSIDYAVMERTDKAVVALLESPWDDLGSWDSIYAASKHDPAGNALEGEVFLQDCTNSLFYAQSRLVAAVDVNEMMLVETSDAVLLAPRSAGQKIKELVLQLKKHSRPEAEEHLRHYRPWGNFESLIKGDRFQVKRMVVRPGQRLSLQKHYHRAEHWIVVRGTATVFIDGQERLLREDESTYIPLGAVHKLENNGKLPLEIIEIQTGAYLGEDDIERLDDIYGR